MDIGKGFTEEKPFVKREDSARLAQSEPKTAEEINLVRKIESRMKNLIQSLNSIESLTNRLNKDLLPQMPKTESEAKVEARQLQGWLENHIANLDTLLWRSAQIHDHVIRLVQATNNDTVSQ